MSEFKISGFADEISPEFSKQIEGFKKLGIKNIEPRNIDGINVSSLTAEKAKEVAAILKENDMGVSSIGSPIGKQKITEDFGPHYELFLNTLDVADILGTKRIRMFSFYLPEGEEAVYKKEIFRRMRELLDAAEKRGITLCHENEHGIYGDSPEKCLEIMKEFDGKMRSVFDPCNFVLDGFESYPKAFNMLNEYIEYMHIKDGDADNCICPAGMGIGGIPEILKELKASGRGDMMLTIEPHLQVFSGLDKLSVNHEDLKRKYAYNSSFEAFTAAYEALKACM